MEPVTERERHTMRTALDELMGPDVASTQVRHLPPSGWADVATKQDLVQLEDRLTNRFDAMLSSQIGGLRAELHGEIGTLRSEMHREIGTLRSGLQGEIGTLRSELQSEIGTLRSEMHREIGAVRSDMQAMTRTYILGNVGLVFTVAAIAFGAARLV